MSDQNTLLGRYFDEYHIETPLGSGGMAKVYRALDTRLQRYVALKLIIPQFRDDKKYIERLESEAQAVARLEHPHIVRIYRFGEVSGIYYMAMQYIEGADLRWLIQNYNATSEFMPKEDILRIVREIGSALDYAHKKGVIHRDIKPENIIVNNEGHAILTDFGLALQSDKGTKGETFGSPYYIAPEQAISSHIVVPQSDFYSLGVTLFEMLTGKLPFTGAEPMDVALKHVSEATPPPSTFNPLISSSLDEVVLRCLAKEPKDRYQTGAELSTALEKALAQWPPPQADALPYDAIRPSIFRMQAKVEKLIATEPLPPLPPSPPEWSSILPPAMPDAPASHPTIPSSALMDAQQAATQEVQPKAVTSTNQPSHIAPPMAEQAIARLQSLVSIDKLSPRQRAILPIAAMVLGSIVVLGLLSLLVILFNNARRTPLASNATQTPPNPTSTSTIITSPTATMIVVAPTLLPTSTALVLNPGGVLPQATPAPIMPTSTALLLPPPTFVSVQPPPIDRSVVPPNTRRLGEFQVEWYCNNQGLGVVLTNNENDWACTQDGRVVSILQPADFDKICQTTYPNTNAFALLDMQKSVRAYNWSCYEYVGPPNVASAGLVVTPAIQNLRLEYEDNAVAFTNISTQPIDMTGFQLQGKEGSVLSASAWGINVLAPGNCLRIFKKNPPAALPLDCSTVIDLAGNEDQRKVWFDGEITVILNPSMRMRYAAN